jgi:hypothetical protein
MTKSLGKTSRQSSRNEPEIFLPPENEYAAFCIVCSCVTPKPDTAALQRVAFAGLVVALVLPLSLRMAARLHQRSHHHKGVVRSIVLVEPADVRSDVGQLALQAPAQGERFTTLPDSNGSSVAKVRDIAHVSVLFRPLKLPPSSSADPAA